MSDYHCVQIDEEQFHRLIAVFFVERDLRLHDEYAMAALTGILSGDWANPESAGLSYAKAADIAIKQADAMMDAKEAKDD